MRWLLLAVAFLLVPVVEIYVIIQVGQAIGAPWTIALLLFESLLGAWIVKREGRRAWAALQTALTKGQLPHTEVADAALVLVGGTLLLTPGFATDVVGFFFVLPPTRPLARRLLGWFVARRVARSTVRVFGGPGTPGPTRGPAGGPARGRAGGSARPGVVTGQVIDDDPPRPPNER
ncbi:MAG: FxsA family protein [Propionibacteriales bacterium]|nr:FxsA family protein [Propionibacteriales bacterium]